MTIDFTHIWDNKRLLKELADSTPAFGIGGPIVEYLDHHYWTKLREIAKDDPELSNTMPGMLVAPDNLTVYIGDTHLAIEYFGPINVPGELTNKGVQVTFYDYRDEGDLISNIIGMKFKGTGLKIAVTPSDLYWNLFVPTSADATELMMNIGWDMTAEDMAFMMNTSGLALPAGNFARMVNCFFTARKRTGCEHGEFSG